MRTLVWFRGKDLRIDDHAALRAAAAAGEVIPLFVLDDRFFAPGKALERPHRVQLLLESLDALQRAIAKLGSQLIVAAGDPVVRVPDLARAWNVHRVVALRAVEPRSRSRDRAVAEALDVPFELYEGETLAAPGTLRTLEGKPFAVFTAFARAFAAQVRVQPPVAAPRALPPLPSGFDLRARVPVPTLRSLGVTPNPRLLPGGEPAARERLRRFVAGALSRYHLGYARVTKEPDSPARRAFLGELLWREFAHSTLWDRPELLDRPFRRAFEAFPWGFDADAWLAWSEGTTGYPVVDAAARQLLTEGFVHNRARMIAASFLTKQLLVHYRFGEAHYLTHLADADVAQNNMGWQWCAGSGCDAQPYFRVFDPVAQGQKHDPDGAYVRRHVPELARMPANFIHRPWQAPAAVLREAGVELGRDYPLPIVDHAEARRRFLMLAADVLGRSRSAPSEHP